MLELVSVPKPQDVSGGPNSLNLEPLVVKPVLTQENVNPILGNNISIPELHSTARETISAHIEISSANPVESGAPQSNMSTANTPNVRSTVNQKPAVSVSAHQTRFSTAKEKAREAPAVRRGPKKKDLERVAATPVNTSRSTTRDSLVGSLEMESSSKTAEIDITKCKVEINTKSEQEPNTKEQLDCAVQSECQSASSILHINDFSSTMDENSPCVQEAEQIDAQYKLKNEGVQCESSSGVAQVEPALVKALSEGDRSLRNIENTKFRNSSLLCCLRFVTLHARDGLGGYELVVYDKGRCTEEINIGRTKWACLSFPSVRCAIRHPITVGEVLMLAKY